MPDSCPPICIDRCVCTRQAFTDLLAQAERDGLNLDELALRTGASTCCGMCRPYLSAMLRSGQTVFTQVLDEADP
ncbi:hypothetical protein [Mucisphaera calidilacus]|nr:hypothetical protein [Mucisphaera calidilacus]